MKFLAVVFVFAFVAVQFSSSAPNPDDDKKDDAAGSPARVTDPGHAGLPTSEVKNPARDQGAAAAVDPAVTEEKKS